MPKTSYKVTVTPISGTSPSTHGSKACWRIVMPSVGGGVEFMGCSVGVGVGFLVGSPEGEAEGNPARKTAGRSQNDVGCVETEGIFDGIVPGFLLNVGFKLG